MESPKTAFNIGARLTLIFAALLVGLSVAQIVYRFTLSTDGWSVYTTEVVESNWIYDSNLVGAASQLGRDDVLLAVEGRSMQGTATSAYLEPPPGWQAGNEVGMTVRREDAQLAVAVPVVHWTAQAAWRFNTEQVSKAMDLLGAFTLLAVGWFTFLRRPDVPSARALLLLCTAAGSTFISGMLPDGLSVQFNRIAFFTTAFFSYAIFGTLLAPSLLAFTWLFPRPKQAIERHPWLALLPYGLGLMVLVALLGGVSGTIGWFATLGMMITSILSLIHSAFTQRDAASRAQMRWAIGGFVVGLGLFMLNFPIALNWVKVTDMFWINLLSATASLGFPVIGVGLAIAVLRYRLYDIDVIIRKTLLYAVLTALLALVYFGCVVLLQGLFEVLTQQGSPLAIVASTLVTAALFNPLRRRVQDTIDRRLYRRKYDATQTLAAFAQTARDEVEIEALAAELTRVVQETMQPESVVVWLKEQRS
jgi:predicted component of type VI protein secretion system